MGGGMRGVGGEMDMVEGMGDWEGMMRREDGMEVVVGRGLCIREGGR
jgi:hypothetical protein